jgi:hypothetical protein
MGLTRVRDAQYSFMMRRTLSFLISFLGTKSCASQIEQTVPRLVAFILMEETIMKLTTIALATVVAVASTAYAGATSHRHHRHHHMSKMSMGMGMGRSGPSRDGGMRDKSRPGGMGVSRNPE